MWIRLNIVGRHNERMNTDQRSNIDAMVSANMEALFSAWSYFHLLQGETKGSDPFKSPPASSLSRSIWIPTI
jgi:hypothetical protein